MSEQQKSSDESVTENYDNTTDAMENVEKEYDSNDDEAIDEDDDPGEEHEFEIIDQVESEEEEEGQDGERGGETLQKERDNDIDDDSSSGDDLDDTELHAMLEKGIDKDTIKKEDRLAPIIKQKIVLKEFESDPFDILPEGWVCVTHNCGMPVYLHKETRVCTMARPYSLGSASARAHDIPLSAIPCLQYRRQMDKEKSNSKPVEEADCKPVEEADGNGKKPSEVSDSTESVPVVVHQASVIHESNNQDLLINTTCQKVPVCPASTAEPKPSPRKLWVVSQESFQKCPMESQKEALHTGTGEFSSIDDRVIHYKGNTSKSSIGCPNSPGEDNIAVTLDSSSIESSCVDSSSETRDKKSSVAIHSSNKDMKLHFLHSHSAEENIVSTSPEDLSTTKFVPSNSEISIDKSILKESPYVDLKGSQSEELDGIEEGEIVDDDKTSNAKSSEVCSSVLSVTSSLHSAIVSEVCVDSASTYDNSNQQNNIDIARSNNNTVHVVREEVTSSSEPSELVTSSSNPLATIKRKIESLKHKRGGKLRKLDGGSSASWPTENNIAVTPQKMVIGDVSNAHVNATANEKLKLHAAEVKIQSAEERAKESLLDSKTLHSYCSKLFQFKTLEVKKYRSWRERRRHIEERTRRNRPELPPSTKLITCPIPGNIRSEDGGESAKKREFILNPTGKSYLCILHEYMQRTLKIQPLYVFKELENSKTPYGATVTISNIEYGTGYASSKKVAKQEAAKETLKVLIPDLFKKISDQEIKRNISDLSFFDDIKVTDPRVNDLGNKVGQPSPFQLLLECLRRNFGMGNTQCEVSTKPLKNQKCEFTINVGKHSAMVVAKNKREGKQLAAQAILAKLHPHVPSWGSLLRLYGTSVEKPVQKPEEINDIKSHAPNHSVLESLREEMRKLHKQKEAIQPKGKIIINSKNLPSKMSVVDL